MDEMAESKRLASDPNKKIGMLDEILAQTQRYSELLLEELPTKSTADEAALTEQEKWEKEHAMLVPSIVGMKLEPYQIKGIKWLISMQQNGLNGILDDQILWYAPLLQTLGFLAHLKGNGLHGPYMIVSSQDGDAIPNWLKGIRFFPNMKRLIYFHDKKTRAKMREEFVHRTVGPDFPIILTTYFMIVQDKKWLANYKWKYVVLDETHPMKPREIKLLEEVKPLPMGTNKLLLKRPPDTENLAEEKAELQSLLKFALPRAFSAHEEFDSWFDFGDKEGEKQQTEEERRTHISKLNAILRPFILRQMEEDVENKVPQKNGAICYKTEAVQHSDAISVTCSKDHAAMEVAGNGAGSCQEVAAEVVSETGGESSPNMRSSQPCLEGNKVVKRQRTNHELIAPLEESNPALHVQVPKSTSSELIFKAIREIPDLARADILRAYSTLIRDDRQFESLMALPMDMRKDWLLMEIGNK